MNTKFPILALASMLALMITGCASTSTPTPTAASGPYPDNYETIIRDYFRSAGDRLGVVGGKFTDQPMPFVDVDFVSTPELIDSGWLVEVNADYGVEGSSMNLPYNLVIYDGKVIGSR